MKKKEEDDDLVYRDVAYNLGDDTKPWDLIFNNRAVSHKVYHERLSICQSCPNYRKFIKQCKICKCIMPGKARLADSRCPIGKWVQSQELRPKPPFKNPLDG